MCRLYKVHCSSRCRHHSASCSCSEPAKSVKIQSSCLCNVSTQLSSLLSLSKIWINFSFNGQCGDFVTAKLLGRESSVQWITEREMSDQSMIKLQWKVHTRTHSPSPLPPQLYDTRRLSVTPRGDIGETFSLCLSMNFHLLCSRWNAVAPTIVLIPVYLQENVSCVGFEAPVIERCWVNAVLIMIVWIMYFIVLQLKHLCWDKCTHCF